jgi:hypothetical protein
MRNIKFFARKNPAYVQFTGTGKKLSLLTLICICFLSFTPYSPQTTINSPKANTNHANMVFTDPEDMVQNGYYFFADHGNGMSVAQFDRMEGNNIYTFNSIKPLLLSFSGAGLWGTVTDAGSIRLATLGEITHLLLCIVAGVYVP